MVDVPWPVTNNPGLRPQEGTGKLVNVFPEPKSDGTNVWRRAPGAVVFARTPSAGSASIDFNVNAVSQTLYSTFFEFIGSSTSQSGGSATNSVTYPTGTIAGYLVILASAADSAGSANPTTPSGFTNIAGLSPTSINMMHSAMWKISTGETTQSLVWDTSTAWVTLAFTIRGAMSTAPIADVSTPSTGASGDPIPPNFTATTADCLMVNVSFMDDDNATAVVAPSTITIAGTTAFGFGGHLFANTTATANNSATVMVGFRPLATTGDITSSTWDVTNGDDQWISVNFTVRHD